MKIGKREKSPLFLRYLLSYALVVLLLFIGITVYLSARTQEQVQSAMVSTQINRLTRIAIRHEDYISGMLSTAEEIGLSPHIEAFDYTREPWKAYELQLQLIPYTSTNTFCDQMYLHFTGDERLYSSSSSMTVQMFADLVRYEKTSPERLKELIRGADRLQVLPAQTVESSLVDGAAPRMVTFLMPLGANPGTTKGTILFMVKESVYRSMFADAIEQSMNTYIFYNGEILAASEDLPVHLSAAEAGEGTESLSATLHLEGSDYLMVTPGSRSWGMRYAALLRMEDINSAVRQTMVQQIAILLLMTALCMGLAVWMSRRHTQPIRDLSGMFAPREEARDELQRISSGIRQLEAHNSELISRLETARPMQRHGFVFRFVKGRFATRQEAVTAAAATGLDIDKKWYQVILCAMPEGMDRPLEMNRAPFDRYRDITGVGVELMALKGMLYLVFAEREEELPEIAELIRLHGNGDAGTCVTAASAPHTDFEEAPAAYLEAAAAWDNRFVMGDKKVLRYEDISSDIADILPRAQKLTASISQALSLGNRELLEDRISDMLYFMKNTSMSPFAFRILYNDVLSTLTRGRAEALSAGSREMYDIFTLSSCDTIDDLDAMLRRLCDALLAEGPGSASPPEEDDVIDQVARYMQEHFDDPEISMAAIAESFELSTTRLSMSFREKKGMTPLEYLTLLRCEKAKELLEETELTIREISLRTGYYDSGSFIRRFKQVTGITPLQYRRSRSGNHEKNGDEP